MYSLYFHEDRTSCLITHDAKIPSFAAPLAGFSLNKTFNFFHDAKYHAIRCGFSSIAGVSEREAFPDRARVIAVEIEKTPRGFIYPPVVSVIRQYTGIKQIS